MNSTNKKYWMHPATVELSRFKVKKGKSERVDSWMTYLREHLPDVLLTLEAERMYVESIFRETRDGSEFLYWYSIQGATTHSVRDSSHEVDKVHMKFWDECIEKGSREDLTTEIVMVPSRIQDQMK